MADLPQGAPSLTTCRDYCPSEIPAFGDSGSHLRPSNHNEEQQLQNVFTHGDRLIVDTDADCSEAERKTQQNSRCLGNDGMIPLTQGEEKQKCSSGLITEPDGNCMENLSCQKCPERAGMEGETKACEASHHHDGAAVANVDGLVDVETCSTQLGNLCVNARTERTYEEGESKFFPSTKGTQGKACYADSERNEVVRQKEASLHDPTSRTQAGWAMVEESEFAIEDSSWPTLAEARNAKPGRFRSSQPCTSEPRFSDSDKEMGQVPYPRSRLPSNQANSQERPVEALKHTNANICASKFKSSYKRGGFSKPSFSVTENLPAHPMGVHVPSANMFVPDHSMKGNGLMGINKYFPSPHRAPAYGPFYYPRAESVAFFPHNPAVPLIYGRGHPGWQHFGRAYGDSNSKHTGFIPAYDQQHMGPRYMHPPMAPVMNMNAPPGNYSSYQGDMSYVPRAPSLFFNYATPYFGRPSGPPGGMVQAAPVDIRALQELLQNQIEYYFSVENMCHDTFLRSKMNDEGFVPLSLIASFPRVQSLTSTSMLIVEALKNSTVVEVKNDKLRSYDWRRWKRASSTTPGTQSNPFGLPSYSMAETVAQENGELRELQEVHLNSMQLVSEARGTAGSQAEPWTGTPAKVGPVNLPMAVASIDSRCCQALQQSNKSLLPMPATALEAV